MYNESKQGNCRGENMEARLFGPTERQVPVIGQGTWYAENDDRRTAIDALRRGIALGMTHIDTAEMYGEGKAEQMVAEAIAGNCDEVFLVSKVLPEMHHGAGRSRRASDRSIVFKQIASIAICSIGVADTR